jgi:hypothetical protein
MAVVKQAQGMGVSKPWSLLRNDAVGTPVVDLHRLHDNHVARDGVHSSVDEFELQPDGCVASVGGRSLPSVPLWRPRDSVVGERDTIIVPGGWGDVRGCMWVCGCAGVCV